MRNPRREVECLTRLHHLATAYEELITFLLSEKLISYEEALALRKNPEPAKGLQRTLSDLAAAEKLQLLTYEWNILPVESIRLLLVTNNSMKELVAST